MFDSFIPISYYRPIFYNIILFVLIRDVIKLSTESGMLQRRNDYKSIPILIIVILYIGLRPISGEFVDMLVYNAAFERFSVGMDFDMNTDLLWYYFMKFSSKLMTAKMFFLICAVLYILPLYLATKKWVGVNGYYLFFMAIASFSFLAYGTNGIRNGIATSLFVMGLTFIKDKKFISYLIFYVAYNIHESILIPLFAVVITVFYKNTKTYLLVWILAIPLSLLLGSFWETFFASFGLGSERVVYLTQSNLYKEAFSSTGFRWDFLLYSFSAVLTGFYFIILRKYKDKVYIQLFNTYVVANAFWILVIRASFSNRFAYLSWFLIPFVIFYPFLKSHVIGDQKRVLALVMITYFSFTYIMYLIE